MRRIYILTQHDLVYYPPMQTLIQIMLKKGIKVIFVGNFSDSQAKAEYVAKGVEFKSIVLNENGNFIQKLYRRHRYLQELSSYLNESAITTADLIWYVYAGATVCGLSKILEKYNYVVHFYEYYNEYHSWKYRFMYPSYKLESFLKKARGVVHCEYNRSQICRSMYGLEKLPYIIPNKPYVDCDKMKHIPDDIVHLIKNIEHRLEGKRVIIYQGYFDAKERRLEEFCQSINFLPKQYVLLIVGKGNLYLEELKRSFESDRIIFIPFIRPPYHLLLTEKASIGILTYHPQQRTYSGVINTLYCAPNKIYEYGKCGVPMVGNDIPGLSYLFREFSCGETLEHPMTAKMIAECVLKIDKDYERYSSGSKKLYKSVNIEDTISNIIESLVN